MTAQRQENKGYRPKIARLAIAGALSAVFSGGLVPPFTNAWAVETERVVVNRHTGLAIDGFDPVAYFTNAAALQGLPDVEASERGVIWRFRNQGNRAMFLADPGIYGPQFGGYDPIDVARGKPVPGRAQIWIVSGERLYLFNREESRDAFAASPERAIEQASAKWPTLMESLSNY